VFGFAEWNGRSLTDNAPNVMFSIAANTPIHLGIGKESVSPKASKSFPYVPAVVYVAAVRLSERFNACGSCATSSG